MGEAIDEPLLRAAGFGPGARAIPLRGGQGRAWQVRSPDGEPLVLKLSGSRWGAELVAAERTALELAASAGLPVPLPRQSGSYGEAHFLGRDWVEGLSLTETLRHCPWLVRTLGHDFGRLQARLHRLPSEGLPFREPRWLIRHVELPELLDAAEAAEDQFVHGDYQWENVVAKAERISAVLDFEFARRGDRRIDLGLTLAQLVAGKRGVGSLGFLGHGFKLLFARAWRRGYEGEAGAFPLDPVFAAMGAAVLFSNLAGTPQSRRDPAWLERARRYLIGRLRVAELPIEAVEGR